MTVSTGAAQEASRTVPAAEDVPLAAIYRGPFLNGIHRGSACIADASGALQHRWGNPDLPVFLRSAAKPIQVLPAVLSGALERFDVSELELVVMCASHRGQPQHREAVLSVLNKAGLTEQDLQCGSHPPIDEGAAADLVRAGEGASPVCNNCSGAHAGMLLACRANGWSTEGYGADDHPLQRSIRQLVAQVGAVDLRDVRSAVDNCGVPTFYLPLRVCATIFSRLSTPESLPVDLRAAVQRVVTAMTSFPEMVGGEGSFDTALMRAASGRLLSKGGAEGFQGVGLVEAGRGFALKVTDGSVRPVPAITLHLLASDPQFDIFNEMTRRVLAPLEISNLQGETVGRIVPLDGFAA